MNKRNFIKFGIIGLLFFLIIVVAYSLYNFSIDPLDKWSEKEETIPFNMETVSEYNIFFSVLNNLSEYINQVNENNYFAIYSLLDEEYIKKNNLTEYNLINHLPNYGNNKVSIKAKRMYYKEYNNNYIYYVKTDIYTSDYENETLIKEDEIFLVLVDYNNLTFQIYPTTQPTENLPYTKDYISIPNNEYNDIVPSQMVTANFICNLYYSDFYNNIINNLDNSYGLLTKDFRKNSFPKRSEYISYIKDKINLISPNILSCEQLSSTNRMYQVKDLNSNIFTFTEESIMNYKVDFKLK